MNSRRSFLKNAFFSGITFCSCSVIEDALAQYPVSEAKKQLVAKTKDAGNDPELSHRHPLMGTKRKPVVINGKRIFTIDTHAHCFFPEAVALAGEGSVINAAVKGGPQHYIPVSDSSAVQYRLDTMDAMGIDMQVLSCNVFWYNKTREVAQEICRINNENLSALCKAYPTRFSAFGSVALQFPDLAVQQLEEIMKTPGLKGIAIQANVLGVDFSDPKFDPVWAKAEELKATLFMHPQSTPQLASRFKGNGWLSNTIGNPLDTTIALQHLIFDGTLDKFPNLKIIAPHGGGYLASYAPRSDHSCFISPSNCDPNIKLKKKPTEYLNQLYFDSLVFTSEALRHLAAQVGPGQIVIGTDQPIPWNEDPIGHVMETPLSNRDKANILGLTAARVLGIKTT
jgi:aminocarboxymuconate-semialdehyde decarboxylase